MSLATTTEPSFWRAFVFLKASATASDIGVLGFVLIAFGAALTGAGLLALVLYLRRPRGDTAP